jgi:hypothetical protein
VLIEDGNNTSEIGINNLKEPTVSTPAFRNDVGANPDPLVANTASFNAGPAYTSKYFSPAVASTSGPRYTSLTGHSKTASEFTHDNMVPFFGGKGRMSSAYTPDNMADPLFDNYTGAGSTQIIKTNQSPMFPPSDSLHYANGSPNNTAFYQERAQSVLSGTMNGVKLGQVSEGRGLGGGTTYQSALDARDSYMPKTVDDLRMAGKPKSSEHRIMGYEGGGHGAATHRLDHAPVPKNRPETFVEIGPERYFTTMGIATAPTARPVQIEKLTNRQDTTGEYTGSARSSAPHQGAYASDIEYKPTNRQEIGALPIGIASAAGRSGGNDAEYDRYNMPVYKNNRTQGTQDTYFGSGFTTAIGAVVAPLLDVLRPTRKENVIGNMRPYENAKAQVTRADFRTPGMYLEPTIRDSTHVENYIPGKNAGLQSDGYRNAEIQVVPNERDTTTDFEYTGVAASAHSKPRAHEDNAYLPNGNKVQTLQGQMVQGTAPRFDGNFGEVTHRSTGQTYNKQVSDRPAVATTGPAFTPSSSQIGAYNPRYVPQSVDAGTSRIDDTLMSAFKNNPYTHKLPGAK